MSYTIQKETKRGYVKLVVSGEQTLVDNRSLISTAINACSEQKTHKVLVDIRGLVGQPGTFADYELAEQAAQEVQGLVTKAALVHRPETKEYTSFFVTVSRNFGLNVRAFIDEQEAIRWFKEG